MNKKNISKHHYVWLMYESLVVWY